MDISAIQRRIEAADIAPEKLSGNSQLTDKEKMGEVARQFEAILLRQILESSQKPVIRSKFTDQSTAASIYRDQVTSQLADSISKSGTLGLARTLEHQLTHQLRPASAGPDRKLEAQPTAHALSDEARPDFCSLKPLVKPE
jgi:Rod binding domain-containing protein